MKAIVVVIFALLFSTVAQAQDRDSQNAESQKQEVQAYTKHLNDYFSGLNVRPVSTDAKTTAAVLKELSQLEDILHGDYAGYAGQLKHIACTKCVCVGCYSNPPP